MEYSENKNTTGDLGLNENPKIPDMSSVADNIGNNTAGPVVSIGNLIVNGGSNKNAQESFEEVIDKARRDTSV